jgi:hypothetical protein
MASIPYFLDVSIIVIQRSGVPADALDFSTALTMS